MKATFVSAALAAVLMANVGVSAEAEGFRVRLGLVNGHLKEVFFGCAAGATSGYDHGMDDLAPPPGIQTGYTAFDTPVVNMPKFFYKDIRGLAEEGTWRFFAEVFPKKPVTVTWDHADLPADRSFTISGPGFNDSMRDRSSVTLESTATLLIKMTPRGASVVPETTTGLASAEQPPEGASQSARPKKANRVPEASEDDGAEQPRGRGSMRIILALVLGAAIVIGFVATRR